MRIITNLVRNSVKFTKEGSVCILLSWIPGENFKEDYLNPSPEVEFIRGKKSNSSSFSSPNIQIPI